LVIIHLKHAIGLMLGNYSDFGGAWANRLAMFIMPEYRSNGANFRGIVNQTLIKESQFTSVGRGMYRLKK
jgi:hypothetical protein